MKNYLQSGYNKNRLSATKNAVPQSATFFLIWRQKSLWEALVWFYKFKRNRQGLSYSVIRTCADLIGSALVAVGLAKFQIVALLAIWLMITVGGTPEPPIHQNDD